MEQAAAIAALGLISAIAVWLSRSAVFVVAGIGVVFFFVLITQRQWKQLASFAVAYALVFGSWLVDYRVSLRSLAGDHYLRSYWAKNFAPFPPKSVSDLRWFYDSFFEFFRSPVGLYFSGLAALTLIVGAFQLHARDRIKFWLLVFPWIFVLWASALHKYPYGGRLALFLVPSAMLFIGEGAGQIRAAAGR